MSPDEEYQQLGELVATMPDLRILATANLGSTELLWYGRFHALLEAQRLSIDAIRLNSAWEALGTSLHDRSVRTIHALLYGALARAELALPAASRGAFVGAGNHFDALAVIGKILRNAVGSLFVIDPYLNERFLTDFAAMAPEGTHIRLLGGPKGVDGTLASSVERWLKQYGPARPLEARIAPKGALHDRIIFDDKSAWALSQSFKDFAARSPGSIIRADIELTALKRGAFEVIWDQSTTIL